MRAVNLMPREVRRTGVALGGLPQGPGYLILGVLAVAVAFVTIAVLTDNTISSRQAKLASLRSQLTAEQALANRLGAYQRFEQLAQARAQTVRQIITGRFDWHAALSDLAKVVPANTSLQSLNATVSPNASSGAGGASTSSLRGAIAAPAFDITGCTRTQDDVARLMSRLRTVNGVTRVTLQSSTKQAGTQSGAATSTGGSGTCVNGPSFHVVVFFTPLPSGAAVGSSVAGQPATTTSTTPSTSTPGAAAQSVTTPSVTSTTTTPSTTGGTP